MSIAAIIVFTGLLLLLLLLLLLQQAAAMAAAVRALPAAFWGAREPSSRRREKVLVGFHVAGTPAAQPPQLAENRRLWRTVAAVSSGSPVSGGTLSFAPCHTAYHCGVVEAFGPMDLASCCVLVVAELWSGFLECRWAKDGPLSAGLENARPLEAVSRVRVAYDVTHFSGRCRSSRLEPTSSTNAESSQVTRWRASTWSEKLLVPNVAEESHALGL